MKSAVQFFCFSLQRALYWGLYLSAATLFATPAHSQQATSSTPMKIGIVAPFSGSYALLADQIKLGAEAAKQHNQYPVELIYIPEYCNGAQDAKEAQKISQQQIRIVIGYLCSESLQGAAPVLARDNIAILSLGSRQPTLKELQDRQNFGIFRLQPDRSMAAKTLADQLAPQWQTTPFAVIEDGTVQGRDFARQVLSAFKARGLEPAFTDTYRPGQTSQSALISRLKRAGIQHILLGGDGVDAAIIARSAKAAQLPLTIAGGEALKQADPQNPLPEGLLMSAVASSGSHSVAESAEQAITGLARRNNSTQDMATDGYALPAYSALQIASQALSDQSNPPKPLTGILRSTRFNTASGIVSFTPAGLRKENTYRLFRFNGQAFEPVKTQ